MGRQPKTTFEKEKHFIELVYSQDSEFNHIQDLRDRKEKALKKAGYTEDDPDFQLIIDMKHPEVNQKIFTFLRKNASNKFTKLLADQQLYYKMMERVLFLQDGDEGALRRAAKLSSEADAIMVRIQVLYDDIFRKEKDVIMVAERNVVKMLAPEERIQKTSA